MIPPLDLVHRTTLAFEELQAVLKATIEEIKGIAQDEYLPEKLRAPAPKQLNTEQWDWLIAELVSFFSYWIIETMDGCFSAEVEKGNIARNLYVSMVDHTYRIAKMGFESYAGADERTALLLLETRLTAPLEGEVIKAVSVSQSVLVVIPVLRDGVRKIFQTSYPEIQRTKPIADEELASIAKRFASNP